MKALLIHQAGSLDHTAIGEAELPAPGPGELLVAVRAVAVNPADWKIIGMGVPGWSFPKVAGLDAAGTVAGLGEGVEGFATGDRVVFHNSFRMLGAFAEYAVSPAHVVAKMPEGLSFEAAAAMPTAGYTAVLAIEDRLRPGPEGTILIHGGAGGLGGFAVQLARLRGARIVATCSAANFGHVAGLGADHCIDYRGEDVAARVKALTGGRGVDAVLNTISPQTAAAAVPMLAFQGHLACCTGLPDFAPLQPLPRGIQISDIALGASYLAGDRRAQARMAWFGARLGALIAEGRVDPMIEEVLPFEGLPEALRRNMTGHQRGKLVIRI